MRTLRHAAHYLRRRLGMGATYVAMRSDGKYWAGPYRWQGRTFTVHRRYIFRWGTKRSCNAAIYGSGFSDTVTAVRWKKRN
jgi:hypothetical protein